jgi:hypothetical protein
MIRSGRRVKRQTHERVRWYLRTGSRAHRKARRDLVVDAADELVWWPALMFGSIALGDATLAGSPRT